MGHEPENSPGASARCSHYREIALNYARTVADDSRKANEWIRLAATQTLRDFDRQDQKEFPFYFDDLAAFRACLFIEHMPHVKGKWAAKGDRLQLSDWQIWITASIFGWKNKKTENRRYRRALILVPRKMGNPHGRLQLDYTCLPPMVRRVRKFFPALHPKNKR